jgi:outer membrane protein OmpA-like peptidoglycan-associated protein
VVVSGNKLVLFRTITFDGAALSVDGAKQLDAVARFLAAHPEVESVRVEGHTSGVGDPSDELSLAGTRAGIVLEYLSDAGIDRARFYAAGYGGMRPLVPGTDPGARSINERIEFVVTKWAEGSEPR